ncbi:recombinase family protein [Rubripirellula sp.]|nr:recombinase family protein [Rubripirellula sp.]
MKKTILILAVAYVRMSDDDQKTSIPQQKKQIQAYAKRHGFKIIRWYEDKGKSGSRDQHKREAFHQMVGDAADGDFTVILCLDTSRFGRLNTYDGAEAKKKLIKAGVTLHTVLEGKRDWLTSTGRIVDCVISEGAHQYSVIMGQKTLQGKLDAFLRGKLFGFKTPYGYARQLTDEKGNKHLIGRTEEFTKPKKWDGELIEGDIDEVRVVKWLFLEFATRDIGFRTLAAKLNEQGIPSATGKKWDGKVIQEILGNEKYVGDMKLGKKLAGAFWRLAGDEVQAVEGQVPKNDRTKQPLLIKDAPCINPFVDRDQWEIVQQKIKRRKAANSHSKGQGGYVLKDVLYCGQCGKPLYGNPNKGTKKTGRIKYVCKQAIKFGKQCDCGQWSVHEDEVLPFLKDKMVSELDREILLASHATRGLDSRPKDSAGLQKKLNALETKIKKGTTNMLLADPQHHAECQEQLGEWKTERAELRARIDEIQQPATESRQERLRKMQGFLRDNADDLIHVQTSASCNGKYSTGVTIRKETFRELLVSNGCRLDFWWTRSSQNRWEVARVRLRLFGGAPFETTSSLIV